MNKINGFLNPSKQQIFLITVSNLGPCSGAKSVIGIKMGTKLSFSAHLFSQ